MEFFEPKLITTYHLSPNAMTWSTPPHMACHGGSQ